VLLLLPPCVVKLAVLLTSGSRSTAEFRHDIGPAHVSGGAFLCAARSVPGGRQTQGQENRAPKEKNS